MKPACGSEGPDSTSARRAVPTETQVMVNVEMNGFAS